MLNKMIKKLRTANGWNQVEFAEKLSVTKQTVSNWENNNIQPSVDMLVKMADIFNVTTDYLLGRSSSASLNAEGLTAEEISHIANIINDIIKK